MAEYEQFLPAITAFIGNKCPSLIMLNAVKSVVRNFCDETEIWVHDCPAIDITKDTTQVRLEIPYQSTICKLWSIEGREALHNKHQPYIEYPEYHLNHDNYLVFERSLSCKPVKTIKAVVSLSTTQDSLSCPDFIYNRYSDAIVSGAIVRLQAMPAQEWVDPNMVALHQPLYEHAVKKAIRDRNDGFMLGRQVRRVTPNYM